MCEIADNRILRNRSDSDSDLESRSIATVLKLHKSIFKGPVAINSDDGSPNAVSFEACNPLYGDSRNEARKRRNSNESKIEIGTFEASMVEISIEQVDMLRQQILRHAGKQSVDDSFGPSCRTEYNLQCTHRVPPNAIREQIVA